MSPTDVQEWGKPLFKQAAYCVRPINHADNVSLQRGKLVRVLLVQFLEWSGVCSF